MPSEGRNFMRGCSVLPHFIYKKVSMKTSIIFLLGLIIGGVATLFLPNTRRDEFNAEIRTQTGALQAHLQQFGESAAFLLYR